jgi:hypothetical protein
MRPAFQDEHHRQAGGPVHRADAPPLTDPDVRVIGSVAGDAVGRVLSAPRRLDGDRGFQLLDAQVALERERRPSSEVGQRGGVLGHDADLSAGHRPLSRVSLPKPALPAARTHNSARVRPTSPCVSSTSEPKVIHRSYPQALRFHVKHDVERLVSLWIPRWTTARRSVSFHVKRRGGGFSTGLRTACGYCSAPMLQVTACTLRARPACEPAPRA